MKPRGSGLSTGPGNSAPTASMRDPTQVSEPRVTVRFNPPVSGVFIINIIIKFSFTLPVCGRVSVTDP